jgi:GxxExxY protein
VKYEKNTEPVIQAAIEVHKNLGPGLLESAYEQCLAYELRQIKYQCITLD